MFIGHFVTGFGFYRLTKPNRIILFILVLGTQVLDIIWGVLTLLGIEGGITGGSVDNNHYDTPWSHSFLMVIVWSVLYAALLTPVFQRQTNNPSKVMWLAGLSVFSHWILDLIVHEDDMLITPFSDQTLPTLDLWSVPLIVFLVEFLLLAVFSFIHYKRVKVYDGSNRKFYVLIGLYFVILLVSYMTTFIGEGSAMEIPSSFGIVIILMIILISYLPYILHPQKLE